MATAAIWKNEFITNLVTTNRQGNPDITALSNGNFLIVWEDDDDGVADGFSTDIVGVIYDALGNAVSDSLYLNFPFGFTRAETNPVITAHTDGGFIVIYEFRSGNDGDLLMGLYDADGSRTAQQFVVSDNSTNGTTYSDHSVASSPDGSFFVTFVRDDGTNQEILGQKFTATGALDGVAVTLRADGFSNGGDLEDILEPETIALNDGRFVTVFSENDNNGGVNERTIEFRISNADGSNAALVNNVSTTDGNPDSNPSIIRLTDGRFMVSWEEDGDVRARIFNDDGTQSVAAFSTTSNGALQFESHDTVALKDGGYATSVYDATLGRLFVVTGFDGIQDGSSTFISDDASGSGGSIQNHQMSVTTDGRILVTWENGEIYTEILDPRDSFRPINVDPNDGVTTGLQGNTTINGSALADTIFGVSGNDTIIGFDGDDVIDGGDGNDLIFGGLGADTLAGGVGFDIASYVDATSGVQASLFTGMGTVGEAAGDTFMDIEALTGSAFNDILVGRDGASDTLRGGDGSDGLRGNGGDDFLFGEDGNDLLFSGFGADRHDGGTGIDTVLYNQAGAGVVVNLTAGTGSLGHAAGDTFFNIENVVGTAFADLIIGEAGANVLQGRAGNDTLEGRDGNDLLIGGNGADTLRGGDGFDTASYADQAAGVTASLFTGSGAAGDTFDSIERLIGSNFNDVLIGRDGANDTLEGGAGNDALRGNGGNDTMLGGDGADLFFSGFGADSHNGGAGIDTVTYNQASAGVIANLTSGTGAIGQAQGDTFISIENIVGTAFADLLVGDAVGNRLEGRAGNDTLDGRAGSDTLLGGNGNDRLDGGTGSDVLTGGLGDDTFVFQAGDQTDRVTDFTNGYDMLDLTSFGFSSFAQVQSLAYQENADVIINFGNGDVVRLVDFDLADFDSADVMI